MEWCIYYDDGDTFSDKDGDAFDAPSTGVIVVVQADQTLGCKFWHRKDYYWFSDGKWFGGESFGLFDYLTQCGPRKVVFGRTIEFARYQEILAEAQDDPRFTQTATEPDA